MAIASSPVSDHLREESSFLFSTLSCLVAVDSNKVFQILLRLSKPRTLSLLLYVMCSGSLTIPICWTCSDIYT